MFGTSKEPWLSELPSHLPLYRGPGSKEEFCAWWTRRPRDVRHHAHLPHQDRTRTLLASLQHWYTCRLAGFEVSCALPYELRFCPLLRKDQQSHIHLSGLCCLLPPSSPSPRSSYSSQDDSCSELRQRLRSSWLRFVSK